MWWEFDLTWQMIKALEFVGLATDVKRPTPVKQVKALEIDNAIPVSTDQYGNQFDDEIHHSLSIEL